MLFDKPKINQKIPEELWKFKEEFNITFLDIFLVNGNKIYVLEDCSQKETNICRPINGLINSNLILIACSQGKVTYQIVDGKSALPFLNENLMIEICIPIRGEKYSNIDVCVYFGFTNKEVDVKKLLSSFFRRFNLAEIYLYAFLMYRKLIKLRNFLNVFITLEDMIKVNFPSLQLHLFNVAFWAVEIAKKLNFTNKEQEKLFLAGILHDVGKIKIRSEIINKKGLLTNEEYEEVKRHVEFGYVIAKEIIGDIYPDIPVWVKNHHEMYDGSGYPEGLKGEEIPLPSRILKVADVIDVLYSPRSYKTKVNESVNFLARR